MVVKAEPAIDATEVIAPGSTVKVRFGELEERWTIVAPHDADHLKERLSEISPLGLALLGRRAGETVIVQAPRPYRVTITSVG